jgi:PAS domain S-box-containing protein
VSDNVLPPARPATANGGQRNFPEGAEAILQKLAGTPFTWSTRLTPGPNETEPEPTPAAAPAPADGQRTAAPAVVAPKPPLLKDESFQSLLEAVPDPTVIVDRDGLIVGVNSHAEELFGYGREELLGRPVEVLVPERYQMKHIDKRAEYVAEPSVKPMGRGLQLFGRPKDGHDIPVEISLSPLKTGEGLLVVSTIRDITERRKAEDQLHQMKERFQTLVEGIPAVTFMADLKEGATKAELYVSPYVEELLKFSQKEWLENPVLWYEQLHPEDRERWHREFAHTVAEGKPFRSDYRFVSKENRVVWVRGAAKVVRDDDGRPLFIQGVAFDITGIKEVEAELDRRVKERTRELDQALADLREQNKELDQFAYVASHDLREPLRTLVSFPQLLTKHYEGKLDAQADDWIRRIIDGGKRMRDLIDDLARYARLLPRDRTFSPVNTARVCQEACTNLQGAFEASGAEAELVVGELPMVMGNDKQLMLLFQNLIGNAIKFRAPDRPVRVEIGSRRDGDGWLCWVGDNGIGIPEKYLKQIFGLGERLHSSSKYPGTGFGLAICENIVRRHGGRIWAESAPGGGSKFCFTLPAAPAEVKVT